MMKTLRRRFKLNNVVWGKLWGWKGFNIKRIMEQSVHDMDLYFLAPIPILSSFWTAFSLEKRAVPFENFRAHYRHYFCGFFKNNSCMLTT